MKILLMIMNQTKKVIFVAALALMIQSAAISQTPAPPKHRVVVQMSEPQGPAWGDLLVHVNNLVANFVEDGGVQVEVVFIGPGLNMLRKTNTTDEQGLKRLADYGVNFLACQNSMGAMKLTTEDLFPFASQVRSGVAEVVRKQEAGWSYIH
jgi:intracellular sulfur oxidation DsrE/DsrF family protein